MQEYKRVYPLFSLCGLNCGLCPRYHTDGNSKCPGCGGGEFHLKHPACPVITCNKKHDNVEYCYQCSLYPCEKYKSGSEKDSFITYKNVIVNFDAAKKGGIEAYQIELNEKVEILEYLIKNYNDGRRKNYYCIAVNLLKLSDLHNIIEMIDDEIKTENIEQKAKIAQVVSLFEQKAREQKLELILRK